MRMAETGHEPGFVGLAEFLASLVNETAEAVHSAQIAQSEDESELRAVASLDIAAAAERLVSTEAAQMLLDQLLSEAGADLAWAKRYTDFLRLAQERVGISLAANTDYNKRGLTAAGRVKILAAARRSIASEQLQAVQRLLSEGPHRVKIASGAVSVKLEMQTYPRWSARGARNASGTGNLLGRLNRTVANLRVIVRPAQREDGEVAGVFGELKINFIVV
jgi:hypothetical protein